MNTQRTRLTGWGWAFVVCGAALIPVGLVAGRETLAAAGLSLVLLALLARGCAALNVARIQFSVSAPARVSVGEEFSLELTFDARRRPFPALGLQLENTDTPPVLRGPATLAGIPVTRRLSASGRSLVNRRGYLPLFHYRLSSTFPLGLARGTVRGQVPLDLAVTPAPRRLAGLSQSELSAVKGLRQAFRHAFDELGSPRSLRDYVAGDPPRWVDWNATARRQTLVVREIERSGLQHVRILFHSYHPRLAVLPERGFETALAHLHWLVDDLVRSCGPLEVWADFMDTEAARKVEWGNATHDAFLRELADASMARAAPFKRVLRYAADPAAQRCLTVVLSNCPRRYWERRLTVLVRGPILCADNAGVGRA